MEKNSVGNLMEKIGNPDDLVEMYNLCVDMRNVYIRIETGALLIEIDSLFSEKNIEIFGRMCSVYERELPKYEELAVKALEIIKANNEKDNNSDTKKGTEYESVRKVLLYELKNNIAVNENFKKAYSIVSEQSKEENDVQTESSDSIRMTFEKSTTTPKAE